MSGGQFDWGGRLQKSNGGAQRLAQHGRKSCIECKRIASLTVRPTSRTVTKVGVSDQVVVSGNGHRLSDKSYPGDNRLISPKSSHRRGGLAPRCRLNHILGLGAGPKGSAVRRLNGSELGSERRETVRSLSVVGAGYLRGAVLVREDG